MKRQLLSSFCVVSCAFAIAFSNATADDLKRDRTSSQQETSIGKLDAKTSGAAQVIHGSSHRPHLPRARIR